MAEALLLARAEELLHELGLRRAAEVVVNHADAAAARQLTYLAFLVGLLEADLPARTGPDRQVSLLLSSSMASCAHCCRVLFSMTSLRLNLVHRTGST
jgi:hypothetical protein